MTEAKFSDGPWECVAAEFGEGENDRLVGFWVRMPHPSLCKADANLISAAPDMYDALKAVNRYRHLENGIADLFHIVVSNDDGKQFCVGDLIDAALSKARGEAQ